MANYNKEPFVLDFPNGQRVEDILKKADANYSKAQLDQQMAQKATMSDVERETQNLQNQINEIVRAPESGGDVAAEVAQARVDADGVTHATLKARCDSDADKTTQLKEDLENLSSNIFVKGYIKSVRKDKTEIGFSVEATAQTVLKMSPYNKTNTVWFYAEKDLDIYFDETPSEDYYALSVLHSPTGEWTPSGTAYIIRGENAARYRKSDGNLPTEENKLHVDKGDMICVTITKGNDAYIGYYDVSDTDMNPAVILNQSQIDQVLNENDGSRYVGTLTKTESSMQIDIGKERYIVNKYNYEGIREIVWRTNACYVRDDDGIYHKMWLDSDSDGVARIVGENDFVGGYHGDELMTEFKLLIDGVEYDENSVIAELRFTKIDIFIESDVYHAVDSAQSANVAFKRNKVLVFDANGMTVKNYWAAQEDLALKYVYLGMLSVERYENDNPILHGYTPNDTYKLHAPNEEYAGSNDMSGLTIHTVYGDFSARFYGVMDTAYNGRVVNYTGSGDERIKAYFAPIYSDTSSGVTTSAGTVIRGVCNYRFGIEIL